MSFANLRIAIKFPLVIVVVSLLTGLATGITAQIRFSTQLEQFAREQLVALRESRQATLENYLGGVRRDLDMLASSLLVEKAMVDFTSAWYLVGDDPGGQLRQLYIDENPHPVGKRADLYDARDGSKYSIRHGYYHRWFRKFLKGRGYYDIFLFTPAGDLIYTVVKEADYATNFKAGGPWADTDLGMVFRTVNDNPTPGYQTFTDFETYGPSNDAPASFIAQPVFDGGGTYLGVLGFQIPIGRINQVMQISAGLGETGEAYMVGADLLMRSDSQFVSNSTVLETKVDTEPARKALAGETGVEIVPEYRGMAMVTAFGPLEFMGVRWAVIAEIGQAELLAPVAETGTFMIVAVALILVLVTAMGIVLARGMSRPIVEMTQNMRRLAAGELDIEIGFTDRVDEIGAMAGAMNIFKENAIKRRQAEDELAQKQAQLEAALDNMPGGILMVDENLKFQVFNNQYVEMIDYPEGVIRIEGPLRDGVRFRAERGDYGPGDPDKLVEQRLLGYSDRISLRLEELLPSGKVIEFVRRPVEGGGMIAVVTDITERKRAEEELAQKEAQLRVALDNMPGGMMLLDRDMNFVLFNSKYRELFEFPDGLVRVGGSRRDVLRYQADRGDFGPVDKDGVIEQLIAIDRSGEAMSRERTIAGSGRTLQIYTAPTPDGGSVSIYTDITERKQAEQALQEAHQIIKDQRDRMEGELNIGREIQMSMIPLVFPPFPDHDEFSVFAALEPAREVGGDFYDYYFIDERRLCFCVGDVSGKGVPAALFMAVTKTLIKALAIDDFSTASILTHVNAELSADTKTSMFVTVFLGILNIRSGEVVYTNAGHNPPYLRRKGGSLQRLDVRHGPVLGAVPGMVYRENTDTMTPGDMLFMYSDGVTEERNADRELFSEKRLVSVLASTTGDSVENAVRDTVTAVKDFRGDGNQEDDITVLAVQFQGSSVHDPIAVFHIMARNDLREIARVIQEFQKFAEEHGIPVEVGRRMSVLFDDLLNNVISYAEAHEIEIRAELATNRLTVTISDDGIPFNPLGASTPDTSLPLDKRVLGGLGIHLVRNLVDDMSYQRRIDRNVLTLVKHIE